MCLFEESSQDTIIFPTSDSVLIPGLVSFCPFKSTVGRATVLHTLQTQAPFQVSHMVPQIPKGVNSECRTRSNPQAGPPPPKKRRHKERGQKEYSR